MVGAWFWLKVARPGLWFQTLWLYLLPTSGRPEVFTSLAFWAGAAFVTYPLSLLVYGWNDVVDYDVDRLNPRKDSLLFGARGTREELGRVPALIAAVNLPSAMLLVGLGGWRLAVVLAAVVAVNACYNLPQRGLRSRPPLELLNQLGYLLVLPLSSWLNGVPQVRPATLLYLVLFCTHAHLLGEIMDAEPDQQAGRRTTATILGVVPTKALVLTLVAGEGALLFAGFGEWVLAALLWLGAVWLALDLLVLHRARPYSRREFRLFGLALNVAGFTSITWVWWRASLG